MQRPCPDTGGGNNLHGRGGLLQRQGEPLAPPHSCLATYPPQLGSPALRLRSRWCLLHGVASQPCFTALCPRSWAHVCVSGGAIAACSAQGLRRTLPSVVTGVSCAVLSSPCSSPCSAQILIQTLFVGSMSLLKVFALICITQI